MAELLIRLKSNIHSDPVKDRMCYKQGDIVVVKPDGHHWGRAEGLPDFAVIRTDRTVVQMESYLGVHDEAATVTMDIPLSEWRLMKAQGDYGQFSAEPSEVARKTGVVGLGTPKQGHITTISLTGLVLRAHTRRVWGVVLGMLPPKNVVSLTATGRATIPFTQLRITLRNKINGAQA